MWERAFWQSQEENATQNFYKKSTNQCPAYFGDLDGTDGKFLTVRSFFVGKLEHATHSLGVCWIREWRMSLKRGNIFTTSRVKLEETNPSKDTVLRQAVAQKWRFWDLSALLWTPILLRKAVREVTMLNDSFTGLPPIMQPSSPDNPLRSVTLHTFCYSMLINLIGPRLRNPIQLFYKLPLSTTIKLCSVKF